MSKNSGHAHCIDKLFGRYLPSSNKSSSHGSIALSTTDNDKMANGRYQKESNVQETLVPVVGLGISPSSSLHKNAFNCQTRNIKEKIVSARPSKRLKTMFKANNNPNTNTLPNHGGIHGQLELQGSSSLSNPVRDVESDQPVANEEIMFGYPTNLYRVFAKHSNSFVMQNSSNTSVPLDLRVNKQASCTVIGGSARAEEQRLCVENDTEKQSPCGENGIKIIGFNKDARANIANEVETFSRVPYKSASEREFKADDENGADLISEIFNERRSAECCKVNNRQVPSSCGGNGTEIIDLGKDVRSYIENNTEKQSRLCKENYIANRSAACTETNNGQEFGAGDKNDKQSENRSNACSETNDKQELTAGDQNEDHSENRSTVCCETNYEQEFRASDENENYSENRSKACSETNHEHKSSVGDRNINHSENRSIKMNNEQESSVGNRSENFSGNRSTICSETNKQQESSAGDGCDSEMEIKVFDETELWEAFDMDEEGLLELGNDIKGLEDIMEYLAGSDETCNQPGYADIACSTMKKTRKRRSHHQQGEQYNLRSKVDLSRMIITRGQKRSGKSKLSDIFSGVRIIGRRSAKKSNTRMGKTFRSSDKSSWKENAIKIEPKEEVSSQPDSKKCVDCSGALRTESTKNLLICLQVDKGTGEINTEQKIPEYCPTCQELLCPSRFTISVCNFNLKTVCVGCGSTISLVFKHASGSCVETARIHSLSKSMRKKGW